MMKPVQIPTRCRFSFGSIILLLIIFQIFMHMGFLGSSVWAGSLIKFGLLEEPRTLNIWLASDRWSRKVLSQMYHPLYIREPKKLKLVPASCRG